MTPTPACLWASEKMAHTPLSPWVWGEDDPRYCMSMGTKEAGSRSCVSMCRGDDDPDPCIRGFGDDDLCSALPAVNSLVSPPAAVPMVLMTAAALLVSRTAAVPLVAMTAAVLLVPMTAASKTC